MAVPNEGLLQNRSISKICAKLTPAECYVIDAPILGDIDSNNSKLTILAGGDQEAFRLCEPLLKVYGHSCELMGGPGDG